MEKLIELLKTYSSEIRWIFGDVCALIAIALFVATVCVWTMMWVRVF